VIVGDYVYGATTKADLLCLAAATGEEKWRVKAITEARAGATVHITTCGDRAYLFTQKGDLVLAELSPSGYREISRAHVIDPVYKFGGAMLTWAPPAFANGCVFARTEAEIVCASLTAE
jgi:hypothetical protein